MHRIVLGVLVVAATACSSARTVSPEPQPQKSALLGCFGSDIVARCDAKPLLFIDGKPTSWDGTDLNPSEIESVEVFKGQKALQLFGPAATNGVVQIKTKKTLKF